MHETGTPRRTALAGGRPLRSHGAIWWGALMAFVAIAMVACRPPAPATPPAVGVKPPRVEPFNFQISSGADEYQIEGFLALARQPGRLPALLVLNGDKGNARQCIDNTQGFTEMGLQVACISIPGYGRSSGPSRFVGPPSVEIGRASWWGKVYI